MMTWWVYDEDGEVVDSVDASDVSDALGQFSYAMPSWFAIPDGYGIVRRTPLGSRNEVTR